jgi:hypothetical protein
MYIEWWEKSIEESIIPEKDKKSLVIYVKSWSKSGRGMSTGEQQIFENVKLEI